jgi:hypothetical protein
MIFLINQVLLEILLHLFFLSSFALKPEQTLMPVP